MPKLLDQARELIRIRHYSIRTEQAYLNWMKKFILFHNKRHPAEMGEKEGVVRRADEMIIASSLVLGSGQDFK